MRRLPGVIVIVLIGGVMSAGCAPKAAEPINLLAKSPDETARLDQVFEPAVQILSGFDPPDPSGQWRIGDRILLGFEIDRGGGRTVRFVLIELKSGLLPQGSDVFVIAAKDVPPPDAQPAESVTAGSRPKSVYVRLAEGDDPALVGRLPARVWGLELTMTEKGVEKESFHRDSDAVLLAVYVFDEAGSKLQVAGTLAPEAYLRGGLFASCDLMRREHAGEAVNQAALKNAFANLLLSLFGLGEVIRETPPLARVIRPVLPAPPLWALLFPPKPDISIGNQERDFKEDERPLPALAGGRRAYLLPLTLSISKQPVIGCVLSVTDPSPPLHLCAGVVGVDGAQVQDPSCKFTMRLLAARRATSTP
jgi:hypothetical protein